MKCKITTLLIFCNKWCENGNTSNYKFINNNQKVFIDIQLNV